MQKDKFVDYVFEKCKIDKGFRARMRRANNSKFESDCWGTLCNFGVSIEYNNQRTPYTVIAAAIAHDKNEQNGILPLGRAIYLAVKDEQNNKDTDVPAGRLRRLLACDNVLEVCQVLNPIFSLIRSRISQSIDYKQLLKDLVWFDAEKTRAKWASDYFKKDFSSKNKVQS